MTAEPYTCGACPCWQAGQCVGGPARYGNACSASEGARRRGDHVACWGRVLEVERESEKKKRKKNAAEAPALQLALGEMMP
jgi:hypothetical protein